MCMNGLSKHIISALALFVLVSFSGCIDDDGFNDSPVGNFDALWSVMNQRYCFFSYKDVDWDEVYSRYRPLVNDNTGEYELFDIMSAMLNELKDGHVNLVSTFNQSRYWEWFEAYPQNFSEEIVKRYYLKQPDYKIAGGFDYRILEGMQIGYMYFGNFSSAVNDGNLNEILLSFVGCKGIIIDVRDNGGGLLTNVDKIVSRFITGDMTYAYIRHKLSPAHDDFSDYYPMSIKAAPDGYVKYYGPIAVLTNRSCYSATNSFVAAMKLLPQVAVFGDKTGGGSGLPFSSQLPNGWNVRFSASPMSDTDYKDIEGGIEPTFKVDMEPIEAGLTRDNIIDAAVDWINSGALR